MKKCLVLLLALLLLVSCALAEEGLLSRSSALVKRMDALSGNATYRACISVSGGDMGRLVDQFAQGDHDQPRMAVAVDISGFTDQVMAQVASFDAALDPVAQQELLSKMASSVVLQLVSYKGAATLAAVNSMMTGEIFARQGAQGHGVIILLYEDATPAAVSWRAENDAVSMTAMFLPDEDLAACESAQAVADWFAAREIPVACSLME